MPEISLVELANGSVGERFNQEIQKVMENIADPNTDPKKARKVTLTFTLKGNEKRDIATLNFTAKSALAPAKDVETSIVLDRDNGGKVIGAELKSGVKGQTYFDEEGNQRDDVGNIIDYQKRRDIK